MTSIRPSTEAKQVPSGTIRPSTREVAIVGMACRLPGANDYDVHWQDMLGGYELLTRLLPADLKLAGVPEALAWQESYRPVTSLVDCPGGLDADFFGISPSEAAAMDPQHRIFLELCWAAMEDAGITPEAANRRIGVFAGGGRHAYLRYVERGFADEDWLDGSIHGLQSDIGNYGDFLATRVSYRLGLTGPSLNVQTACSTGLMAVHLACGSITAGEVEVALAGAVNVHTPQVSGYHYEEGSICSAAGRLRPFDERADGSVFGNGGGVVLLKSLAAAERDGDRIVAVIRSSACNNDGNDKMSYTAPSVSGQAAAISEALRLAAVDPASIGYVEAHGTGTPLGDPIEIQALNKAFALPNGSRTCALGTAKSQIGHLGPAAGIVGLIRAALVVERAVIPQCVNFEVPSSRIAWHEGPFYVPTANTSWAGHRRAGVSAFGVGGTNVHAVLEQAPLTKRATADVDRPLPVVLSAQNPVRLREQQYQLADHLDRNPSLRIEDVSRTSCLGRVPERLRASWAATDVTDLATQLRRGHADAVTPESPNLPVVLAFPGQGDQYADAARALYHNDPVFTRAVDACASALQEITGFDIRTVMYPEPRDLPMAAARIHRAQRAQEALFTFEYSLGCALIEAGLVPTAMIGHSAGEYAAAVLSGILSLRDASKLVAARGRMMEHEVPAGAMMAVGLTEAELEAVLPGDLDLAAINAPGQCVVSGSVGAIARFEERLIADGVLNRVLGTSVAAHSRLMDSVRAEFAAIVGQLRFGQPTIPMASTLLGDFECSEALTEPGYWTAHLRQPVRFMAAAEAVLAHGRAVVVEVGPGRATTGMFRQLDDGINLPVLSPWRNGHPEPNSIAEVIGQAWELGAQVDWARGLSDLYTRSVRLPGRSHQRSVPWTTADSGEPKLPGLAEQSWTWAPRWALAPAAAAVDPPGKVVVFTMEPVAWPADLDAEVTVIELPATDDNAVLERLAAAGDVVRAADAVVFAARAASTGSRQTEEMLSGNFWPLLRVGTSVAEARAGYPTPLLVVVPTERGTAEPELELVVGPCRVLPQEYPDLLVSLVRGIPSATLVEDELAAFEADGDIAYVHGRRCRRTYEQVESPLGPEPWRSDSTYLITGGTGGIGLALADAMAATSAIRLVLTRRPRPADTVQNDAALEERLRVLRSRGLVVDVVDVDVRDQAGMHALRERFGPFDGIVHAAGVASGRLLSGMDVDSATSVVSPKVDGIQVLERVVVDDATRWLALCSSMSSRIGGIGHADYSSANAYLDAWAERAGTRSPRVVSLDYDALTESGMAVNEARKARAGAGDSARAWHTTVPAHDWIRQEHVVDGQPILPGTAIVELVYRAARDLLGLELVELRGLDLLRPTGGAAGADLTIGIEFAARNPGWAVTVSCGEAGAPPVTTATCIVTIAEPPVTAGQPVPAPNSSDAWPDQQDEPAGTSAPLVELGPHWDCASSLRRMPDGRTEARSVLADAFGAEVRSHPLHPALLDNALGATLSRLDHQYLPMSYERIVVWRHLPREVHSRIRTERPAPDMINLDVECSTPTGEPVLTVEGYQLRRIQPGRLSTAAAPSDQGRTLIQQIEGDVGSLRFTPAPRPACTDTNVVVEVRATGLNFKEVLMAGGLIDQPEGYRFGLECAGVVVEAGTRAGALRVGDAVFGLGEACFDERVAMQARLVRPIPRGLDFEQAATIPVAFTTAYDCLTRLAGARAGESVLIHAVTGGVGSAAVQIARHLGLTVLGTASTQQKREHALAMGAVAVFDSRSLDFEREVIERGGVDIVLNSLGGDFIEAGLRCLRSGGRFVEMGRRDILAGRSLAMEVFSQGTTFAAYYPDVESPCYESSLDEVARLLRESVIRPLPYQAFPADSVAEAFLRMSRADHVGKVVVTRNGSRERSWAGGYSIDDGGLSDDLAVSALKRAVQLSEPCVLVTARDVREARTGVVVASHVLDDDHTGPKQPAALELVGLEGDTEHRLGQIWANVLRLDTVSRDDTFVGLGGDSLYATQVVGRVAKEFGQRIPPAAVLGTTTLAELARTLESGAVQAVN